MLNIKAGRQVEILRAPDPDYVGRVGYIIHEDEGAARIAFPEFWSRPDGMDPEEAKDNTWAFPGEYRDYPHSSTG